MKLIRKLTNETVTLDDGFLWSDEFEWKAIEQSQDYAVNGALIIQEGKKLSGRPITLTADQNMAWLKRHVVSKLKTWSALQSEQFTLQLEYPHDYRQFNVIFNHSENAIEAKPVKDIPTISDEDYYNVTLRFTEVTDGD